MWLNVAGRRVLKMDLSPNYEEQMATENMRSQVWLTIII